MSHEPARVQMPLSLLEQTRVYLHRGLEHSPSDRDLLPLLDSPRREWAIALPLVRANGSLVVARGWRAQADHVPSPSLGGLVLSPAVGRDDVAAASLLRSWTHALLELPHAAAAGGITAPADLSDREREQLLRGYARGLAVAFAGDVLTAPSWQDHRLLAVCIDEGLRVTGAPASLSGSGDREGVHPLGATLVLQRFLATQGKSLASLRIAVLGRGPAVLPLATHLAACGSLLVAVGIDGTGVCDEAGVDLAAITRHLAESGSLAGFDTEDELADDDVLAGDCDAIVLAGPAGSIGPAIAPHVKASVVLEAGYGVLTPAADELLRDNGVTVLPDLLALAAPALADAMECGGGLSRFPAVPWADRLAGPIATAFDAVNSVADDLDCDYRTAATTLAIQRLSASLRLRGLA